MHTRPRGSYPFEVAAATPSRLIAYLLATVAAAALLGFLPLGVDTSSLALDSPGSTSNVTATSVVHAAYNSVVPVTRDPWLAALASITHAPESVLYWIVFTLGVLAWLQSASAILAAIAVPLLFGLDLVLLGAIAWLPWLALGLRRFALRGELPLLVMLLFIGMRLPYGAGWLLPWPLVGAALALFAVQRSVFSETRRVVFASLALIAGISITFAAIPSLPTFDYPLSDPVATVVADDGFPGLIQPLLGPSYPLQVIDGVGVREFLLIPFVLTVLVTGIVRTSPLVSSVALLCIGIELFAGPGLRTIAPLAALARLVPGGMLYPIVVLLLVGVLLTQLLTTSKRHVAVVLVAALVWGGVGGLSQRHSELVSVAAISTAEILKSPSLAVTRTAVTSGVGTENLSTVKSWSRCDATVAVARTSRTSDGPGIDSAEVDMILNDTDPSTRISLGQSAGSTLKLCFKSELPRAIWLEVGAYKTDFPRAFSIGKDHSMGSELIRYDPWLGAMLSTPAGLPFYGDQGVVKFLLPTTLALPPARRCLVVGLLSDNTPFDWSVAELRCSEDRNP